MDLLHAVTVAAAIAAAGKETDSDGDGLSDFAETTKYLTDPNSADSDGDGLKDFIPDERREYTYSVRAVMRVLPPIDEKTLTDDYQDGRVLKRGKDFVEIEVVVYPRNGVAARIEGHAGWRKADPALARWLAPGPTTNFDAAMTKDMLESLARDGIDLDAMTDAQAAPRVAKWLLDRAQFEDSFTTFAVEWKNSKPSVARELENQVAETLRKHGRSLDEQWRRELLGKGMYETRVRGTCTSTAIYLQTGLRAIGIPTRTIVCIPVIDATDPEELALIDGIGDETMRDALKASTKALAGMWASHTFNEVHVGGRWRRLNDTRLGQNVAGEGAMGLFVRVNTFADHAEAGLVEWGKRAARDDKSDTFGHGNPYSCLELSDLVGRHADPARVAGLEAIFPALTIERVDRYFDVESEGKVKMRLDDPDTAGHFVMSVRESLPGWGTDQYAKFYELCGKRFALRAAGRPDVPARATRGYWVIPESDVRAFYLRVEPDEFAAMEPGVDYSLEYVDDGASCGWRVDPSVVIRS